MPAAIIWSDRYMLPKCEPRIVAMAPETRQSLRIVSATLGMKQRAVIDRAIRKLAARNRPAMDPE
jgi:hypothetical protein